MSLQQFDSNKFYLIVGVDVADWLCANGLKKDTSEQNIRALLVAALPKATPIHQDNQERGIKIVYDCQLAAIDKRVLISVILTDKDSPAGNMKIAHVIVIRTPEDREEARQQGRVVAEKRKEKIRARVIKGKRKRRSGSRPQQDWEE